MIRHRPLADPPRAATSSKAIRSAIAAVLGMAIIVVACDSSVTPSLTSTLQPSPVTIPSSTTMASHTPDPVPLETPPTLALDDVPLICGGPLTFSVDALEESRPGAEDADHPAAESLRQLLVDGSLPNRSGWRLVVFNEDGALFLLPGRPEEGVAFWYAELGPAGANWRFVRSGQCDIQPAFVGVEAARWELSPEERVGPDTRSFEVLVFEQGCASGASPDGRIVGPAVVLMEDSVTVILGTRPLPGPQTCEPGPPATVRVELPEPVGDRQLLDGATFPAEPRS